MKPKPFLLCFESHKPDGLVWSVQQSRKWHAAESVRVLVPTVTEYRGKDARQPKAYLKGMGVLHRVSARVLEIRP